MCKWRALGDQLQYKLGTVGRRHLLDSEFGKKVKNSVSSKVSITKQENY
jgi:hypothetical protein